MNKIFIILLSMIVTSFSITPLQAQEYIDVGGTGTPQEGKRLSEEEVEKIRAEMDTLKKGINTAKQANVARDAARAAKSAKESQAALNALKELTTTS